MLELYLYSHDMNILPFRNLVKRRIVNILEDDSGIQSGVFFIMPPESAELTDEDTDEEISDYEDDCNEIFNESQFGYQNKENLENDFLGSAFTLSLFTFDK